MRTESKDLNAANIYGAMPEDRRIEVRCLMSPSLIPSLQPLLPAFKLQDSGFGVQGCGGGFSASMYEAITD